MTATTITIEIDADRLASYSDSHLATVWHVAQANPAPHGDRAAGELVERIGREIIGRWLRAAPMELWHHQGRDYYWSQLARLARFEPGPGTTGSPEWVPKPAPDAASDEHAADDADLGGG